jgi:hypothetical protein
MRSVCSIDGCGRAVNGRGYCITHYRRWRLYRDPMALPGRFPATFWRKVDKSGPPTPLGRCWLWTGAVDPAGYGRSSTGKGRPGGGGRSGLAHRVSYELVVGPIPAERPHLDHLCRVKACVNPTHLEPVTQPENNRRQHLARLVPVDA